MDHASFDIHNSKSDAPGTVCGCNLLLYSQNAIRVRGGKRPILRLGEIECVCGGGGGGGG